MRKGVRVFSAAALLVVLSSGSTVFATPRDAHDASLFARFLSWVYSRFSPPTGAPAPPESQSRFYPPIGSPAPAPEPQSRLSPPDGAPAPQP